MNATIHSHTPIKNIMCYSYTSSSKSIPDGPSGGETAAPVLVVRERERHEARRATLAVVLVAGIACAAGFVAYANSNVTGARLVEADRISWQVITRSMIALS